MIEITDILPHRYPFLMVDRVVEIDRGVSIKAYKNITSNEPQFTGHFPGEPIFPGVLIIEAMAQVAGLLGCHYFLTAENAVEFGDDSLYLFVGADKVRFKRPVVPGDQLMMEARVMSGKLRKIWKFECKAQVGDEFVCGAEVLCAVRNKTT